MTEQPPETTPDAGQDVTAAEPVEPTVEPVELPEDEADTDDQ